MQTFDSFLHLQSLRLGVFLTSLCLLTGSFTLRAQDNKKAGKAACEEANALFNQGLYKLAIVSYQKFLKKYPNHPKAIDVRYGLGLSYFLLNQYGKAAALLGKIVGDPKCPDVPRAYYFWGQSLMMLGKPANAEGAYDVGIRAFRAPEIPQDFELMTDMKKGRLEALFQLNKWKEVVAVSKSLRGKGGVRVALQGALALYELKQFKEAGTALAILKPSVKNTSYEQQTHFLLAESLRSQKQFSLAIKEFEVAASLKGGFASEALYRIGFLQFHQRNYKAAVKIFDDFRVMYKDSVEKEKPEQFQSALIYLGRAQLELHQYKVAEKLFADLAAESKADAKVFLWQSSVLQRQKKYDDAVKILDGAIKKFPNDPEKPNLLFDLAHNNLRLNNFTEAGKAFDDLQKIKPDFGQMADLLWLNAQCKFNTNDYDTSLKLCGEFLQAHAQHERAGDVRFLEAENQLFLEQHAKAISLYGSFLKSYEAHKHEKVNVAKMRIGQSRYKLKDWSKALTVLKPLADANVKGQVFEQLEYLVGDCYYKQEKWKEAVEFYSKFISNPNSKSTSYVHTALYKAALASEELKNKAGSARELLQRKNSAIAAYQKLDKGYPNSMHLPDARLKLGKLLYDDGKYAEARVALEKVAVLKEHKLRPNAEFYLAWVALGEKKADIAAQQFGALADSFPQHELAANARLQQGMKLFEAEQFPVAQGALQKFIADYPKHEEIDKATYQLGFSQLKQDQWKAALVSFSKVPAKSEHRADALYQSAWCQKGAGKKQDAVPYYEELLAEFSEGPLANTSSYELAELEYDAKKPNEVIRRLQGLIIKKPKKDLRARAQQLLGLVYFDQKNFTEALLNFKEVVKSKKPTFRSKGDEMGAEAQFLMGKCYFEQEMFDEAIKEYKKVETGFSFPQWQSKAIYELAMILDRKGDKTEAQEQFKRLIQKFPDTPAAADAKAKLD